MFFANANLKNNINTIINDQKILLNAACKNLDILLTHKFAHIEHKKFLSVPRTDEERQSLPVLISQAGLKDYADSIENAISTLIMSIEALQKNPTNNNAIKPHLNILREQVNKAVECCSIYAPNLLLDRDIKQVQKCITALAEKLNSDSQNIHIPQKMVR